MIVAPGFFFSAFSINVLSAASGITTSGDGGETELDDDEGSSGDEDEGLSGDDEGLSGDDDVGGGSFEQERVANRARNRIERSMESSVKGTRVEKDKVVKKSKMRHALCVSGKSVALGGSGTIPSTDHDLQWLGVSMIRLG